MKKSDQPSTKYASPAQLPLPFRGSTPLGAAPAESQTSGRRASGRRSAPAIANPSVPFGLFERYVLLAIENAASGKDAAKAMNDFFSTISGLRNRYPDWKGWSGLLVSNLPWVAGKLGDQHTTALLHEDGMVVVRPSQGSPWEAWALEAFERHLEARSPNSEGL